MRPFVCLVAAATAAAALAGAASADRVYHTHKIKLTGGPGWGTVINIHASGPRVFAHELYRLHHGTPGTYQVALQIFPEATDCTGTSFPIAGPTFTTNRVGNGHSGAKFTPEDAAPIRHSTVSVIWTFTGPATYASACQIVTLD